MSKELAKITGKLLVQGCLILQTPLIIGGGDSGDEVDIAVLKDKTGTPYIPATSLTGVLRHYFHQNTDYKKTLDAGQLHGFWGADYQQGEPANNCLSALFLSDLTMGKEAQSFTIKVRDGVKITAAGIAEDKKKFDYKVLEPGVSFNFKLVVTLRKAYDRQLFEKITAFLIAALASGKISLGAMTTKGFGRCQLTNVKYHRLDFTQKEDVLAWLGNTWQNLDESQLEPPLALQKNNHFTIDAWFEIKNSLIVRAYSGNPGDADATHITSNGQAVLPGTAIKGAIRSRARRIINTMGGNGEELLKDFFGWVDDGGEDKDPGKTKEKYKSRVIIEEMEVKNVVPAVHNRIKIDRFTAGVMHGALFNTAPLWPGKNSGEMVRIKIILKNKHQAGSAWEAGLLLLILKDLWTADLPIGGEKSIGRGVLEGIKAKIIMFDDHNINITRQNDAGLAVEPEDTKKLEKLVTEFVEKCQQEVAANE